MYNRSFGAVKDKAYHEPYCVVEQPDVSLI